MALLNEYALTPDIFDITSYPHKSVCDVYIKELINIFREDGLARNLRRNQFNRLLKQEEDCFHPRMKNFLTKTLRGRCRDAEPNLDHEPATDVEWFDEAYASHAKEPLSKILVGPRIFDSIARKEQTARIEKIFDHDFKSSRSNTIRLPRTIQAYKQQLRLILKYSNSIIFIDPHLDPLQKRYQGVEELLRIASTQEVKPMIQIHRVSYTGSGQQRQLHNIDYWTDVFSKRYTKLPMDIDIFLWSDFHDRYLLSDLIAISMSNGFDTSNDHQAIATWTRMDYATEKDNIYREFDPKSKRRKLNGKFTV